MRSFGRGELTRAPALELGLVSWGRGRLNLPMAEVLLSRHTTQVAATIMHRASTGNIRVCIFLMELSSKKLLIWTRLD